jgi:hypothetical protein
MTVTGYEGFGADVLCVCKGRRTYDAVRATLGIKVFALTTNVSDVTCEYVVYPDSKLTKAQRARAEAFAAGVIAGVRYYS